MDWTFSGLFSRRASLRCRFHYIQMSITWLPIRKKLPLLSWIYQKLDLSSVIFMNLSSMSELFWPSLLKNDDRRLFGWKFTSRHNIRGHKSPHVTLAYSTSESVLFWKCISIIYSQSLLTDNKLKCNLLYFYVKYIICIIFFLWFVCFLLNLKHSFCIVMGSHVLIFPNWDISTIGLSWKYIQTGWIIVI